MGREQTARRLYNGRFAGSQLCDSGEVARRAVRSHVHERSQTEAVERRRAALPVGIDLHVGLEVHADAEQRLELEAGRGARLPRAPSRPCRSRSPSASPARRGRPARSASSGPLVGLALLDLVGGHRDRVRQLVVGRPRAAARAPARRRGTTRAGRSRRRRGSSAGPRAAGPRARPRARRRRRRCAPTAARTPRSRRARPTRRPGARACVAGPARSILFTTSTTGVRTCATSSATKRSPGPIGSFASMRKQTTSTSPSVVERPAVRALAEQRARLVHAGRVEEHDLRRRRSCARRAPACASSAAGRRRSTPCGRRAGSRSVDFPTLGRPTSETKPDRNGQLAVTRALVAGASARHRRRRGVMSTDTMRRPCMRSAQNSSPSTRAHSPSIGTWPSVLNTRPPTVSHSLVRAARRRAAR